MMVISDTSSISNLIQVGLVELLRDLYGEVVVTPAVQRELYRIDSQVAVIEKLSWIKIQGPKNQKMVLELLEKLDLGESESIVLAMEMNANYLLIDESSGRRIATELGIQVTGLLGVLIQAKKLEKISEVSGYIQDLRRIGFRLNQKLVQDVLEKLGEL